MQSNNIFLNKAEVRGIVGNVNIQQVGDRRHIRLSVATDHAYKDKDGNATVETTWHMVTAWEGEKVNCLDKIKKGSLVHATGRLRNNRYTDQSGIERYSTEILANHLEVVSRDTDATK